MQEMRNSSIELFRIIAMFMVVIVHFNGWFVGGMPSAFDFVNVSNYRIGQALIESFSIMCVNCFVILSGYFGVKLKGKKIWNILILLLVIKVPFVLVEACVQQSFSFSVFKEFFVISHSGYFIIDYLLLMLFSPVLNAFIDNTHRNKILLFALVYWGSEIYFDFIKDINDFGFNHGYSFMHFVLLYFLGRLLFLYDEFVKRLKIYKSLLLYLMSGIIVFIQYLCVGDKAFWYSNPIVVLEAFFLFLPFLHYKYYVPLINKIASSTLAVYILHTKAHVWLSYIDVWILEHFTYINYLLIIYCIMFLVFTIGICYDKVSSRIYRGGTDKLYNLMYKKISHGIRKINKCRSYYL